MPRDVELAKRIWSHFEDTGLAYELAGIEHDLKYACLAAARDILGRSEDGKRDLLFESLCQAMGADWKAMPKHEQARYNVATQQLREIHATPIEVLSKARRYEYLHPDWPLTPTALISHWSTLGNDKTRRVPIVDAPIPDEDSDRGDEGLVGPPPELYEALRRGPIAKPLDEHPGLSPDTLGGTGPSGHLSTPDTNETRK